MLGLSNETRTISHVAPPIKDGLSRSGAWAREEGEKIQNLLTKHRFCIAVQFIDSKDLRDPVISLGLMTICKP